MNDGHGPVGHPPGFGAIDRAMHANEREQRDGDGFVRGTLFDRDKSAALVMFVDCEDRYSWPVTDRESELPARQPCSHASWICRQQALLLPDFAGVSQACVLNRPICLVPPFAVGRPERGSFEVLYRRSIFIDDLPVDFPRSARLIGLGPRNE